MPVGWFHSDRDGDEDTSILVGPEVGNGDGDSDGGNDGDIEG